MPTASFVFGLIFVAIGGWLLVWRLLHKYYLGEFWNNTPLTLSWGVTIVLAGAAVAVVGFAAAVQDCDHGCGRVGGNTGGSTMVVGGIVALVGLAFLFCPCCARDPKTIYYDWESKEDNRGYLSGLDFVALGIGLAVLASEDAMGVCPQSCAEAVMVSR